MIPFLKNIASAYSSRYSDLSEFCFIFPNKRSATFFLKYLKNTLKKPSLAPETSTISNLAEETSGYVIDNRIDLLFLLYNAYIEIQKNNGENTNEVMSFEAFRSWGDIVLSDFNDVDMYNVDVEAIFKNVRDFKNIQSDFLTDGQLEVMKEYFGYADQKSYHERFWKAFDYKSYKKNGNNSGIKDRFIMLWQSLYPIYKIFNQQLEDEGLAYSGKTYKKTYQKIQENGKNIFHCKKLVLVGFNALTKIEWLIFTALKTFETEIGGIREEFCDFIWDYSGSFLKAGRNTAGKFLSKDIQQFPMPQWLDLKACNADGWSPEIEVNAAPSNSIQAKLTGEIISDIASSVNSTTEENTKIAIVLPDEDLLMPILNSFPKNIRSVNLTMGYPLRLTSAFTYIGAIKKLQIRKQHSDDGIWRFSSDDIKILFSHPYIHEICGSDSATALKGYINNFRKFWLTENEVLQFAPQIKCILYPITSTTSEPDTITYIDNALVLALDHISRKHKNSMVKFNIDSANINAYRNALQRLSDSLQKRKISLNFKTVFLLAERFLSTEKVNFTGEPLQGIQIMGLLETRCLDFDYVIIPSMNERIFPQRFRSGSFIPNALRIAYGMSSSSYQESIFSYYFYRLITRAKKVWLIYDSRSGDRQTGEPSRYILQLQHLYKPHKLLFKDSRFSVSNFRPSEIIVEKNNTIMAELENFRQPKSGRNFSASTLINYMQCSMRFFLEKIIGIDVKPEPKEELDAISQGNILHNAMMEVYLSPDKYNKYLNDGIVLTKEKIESIIRHNEYLENIIIRNVNREYYFNNESKLNLPLKGAIRVSAKMLLRQLKNILQYDLSLAPFRLYGCEIKGTHQFPLSDGTYINMTYAIDRLDSIKNNSGNDTLRIVDYKTGKVYIKAENVESMFNGDIDSKHFFQLQLYANLFNFSQNGHTGDTDEKPVQLRIYDISKLHKKEKEQSMLPILEGETILLHNQSDINERFLSGLDNLLREIMNPLIPFRTSNDTERCKFCNLKSICGR